MSPLTSLSFSSLSFLTSLLQSRPPAASLERCCDSCFNKIRSRVRQFLLPLCFFVPRHCNTLTSVAFLLSSYFLVLLLLQVLQSPSSPAPPPPPFPSKLADLSPVAPPSFDQWQQQQQHQQPHNSSVVYESSSPIPESTSSSALQSAGNVRRRHASHVSRDSS